MTADPAVPRVWQFRTAVTTGTGVLNDSGQRLGDHIGFGVALGDLDGDGDLDAFVANYSQGNRVWLNHGGAFSDNGQSLGNHNSYGVALGDLDGDGDLDAFAANSYSQGNRVWLDGGAAAFTDSGQSPGNHSSRAVSLGDVDGDGDLDAFLANWYLGNESSKKLWLNSDGQRPLVDW